MTEFRMPKLGADMTAGTLVAWHKKPGEAVRRGEVIADVETDKGVIEVEIFTSGILDRLLVQPGQRVPVGTALATVTEDMAAPVGAEAARSPAAPSTARAVAPASVSPVAPDLSRLRISPSARELARQLGVDPTKVQGTGRGGAITREDIERAAGPTPAPDRAARMRQAIAAAMSRSKRDIPHYYLSTTIDLQRALAWLAAQNEQRPVEERLLPAALLLKAVALALREVPELNAFWMDNRAVPSPDIHVGLAISLRAGGLVAPALHHTDRQSLEELMRNLRDLVQRARAGSLRGSELADPTVTVTNLGEQGVEAVFGIIYPPQVALVGLGKVVERPWCSGGQVVPRPVLTATLSADHRATDGHRGALFLAALDRLLQEPDQL